MPDFDLSFTQSPAFSLVLATIAVLSLVFAYYSHRKNRINQRLVYGIEGRRILRFSDIADLTTDQLRLGDNVVDELHRYRLLIANEGTVAVEPRDIAEGRIVVRKHQIDDRGGDNVTICKIAEIDEPAAGFKLNYPKSTEKSSKGHLFEISFDFLPPRSGVIVDFITTVDQSRIGVFAGTKSYGPIRNIKRFSLADLAGASLLIVAGLGTIGSVFLLLIATIPRALGYFPSLFPDADGALVGFLTIFGAMGGTFGIVMFTYKLVRSIAKKAMRKTSFRWNFD